MCIYGLYKNVPVHRGGGGVGARGLWLQNGILSWIKISSKILTTSPYKFMDTAHYI